MRRLLALALMLAMLAAPMRCAAVDTTPGVPAPPASNAEGRTHALSPMASDPAVAGGDACRTCTGREGPRLSVSAMPATSDEESFGATLASAPVVVASSRPARGRWDAISSVHGWALPPEPPPPQSS